MDSLYNPVWEIISRSSITQRNDTAIVSILFLKKCLHDNMTHFNVATLKTHKKAPETKSKQNLFSTDIASNMTGNMVNTKHITKSKHATYSTSNCAGSDDENLTDRSRDLTFF